MRDQNPDRSVSSDAAGLPLRKHFLVHLLGGLGIVWPILAALIGLMAVLGCSVALLEKWSLFDGLYFAFVSGLTIGYGDLAPKAPLARSLAVGIGFVGIVFSGLVAAVAVQALQATLAQRSN